jgi:hypothetical protein
MAALDQAHWVSRVWSSGRVRTGGKQRADRGAGLTATHQRDHRAELGDRDRGDLAPLTQNHLKPVHHGRDLRWRCLPQQGDHQGVYR